MCAGYACPLQAVAVHVLNPCFFPFVLFPASLHAAIHGVRVKSATKAPCPLPKRKFAHRQQQACQYCICDLRSVVVVEAHCCAHCRVRSLRCVRCVCVQLLVLHCCCIAGVRCCKQPVQQFQSKHSSASAATTMNGIVATPQVEAPKPCCAYLTAHSTDCARYRSGQRSRNRQFQISVVTTTVSQPLASAATIKQSNSLLAATKA